MSLCQLLINYLKSMLTCMASLLPSLPIPCSATGLQGYGCHARSLIATMQHTLPPLDIQEFIYRLYLTFAFDKLLHKWECPSML